MTSLDGSVALREEVNAILKRLEGEAIAAAPKGKTLGDALLRYSGDGERRKPCADFLSLAPSTQVEYLRMANEIRAHYGAAPLRIITPAKVLEMRDDWAPRGYKATNDRLQVLKNALKPALLDKRVKCNAFEGVADMVRPHYLATPNLPWENDEVAAGIAWCLEREQPGLARAIGLGRWGGFRRGTICHVPSAARRKKSGPKGEIGTRIVWITEKRKVLCDRREDPRLTALIESTPNKALTIAYNADGAPWKERQLNQAFDRMIADLAKRGLVRPDLTIHGLRHARGNELAETSASDAEIMSQLDQATEHAARIYRRNAARRRMADAAQDRIDNVIQLQITKNVAQETG